MEEDSVLQVSVSLSLQYLKVAEKYNLTAR